MPRNRHTVSLAHAGVQRGMDPALVDDERLEVAMIR
jgi:hypothetical protein